MSQYAKIGQFGGGGNNNLMSNPLSYCAVSGLESMFDHGSNSNKVDKNSGQCQKYMSSYCSENWDGVCEYLSKDTTNQYPNVLARCDSAYSGSCGTSDGLKNAYSQGEILIRNTAMKKYMSAMSSNCSLKFEPFNPVDADSPLMSTWVPNCGYSKCVAMYEVDPATIDTDPVMNKILQKPQIALDILVNIYNTARNNSSLRNLARTKLYNQVFMQDWFQRIVAISRAKAEARA
jgi:hypothetical protein